ncbi:MAG: hypothetical protein Sylvanvirus27_3 [Sylvanvirus sp.]|uniref:Uncharacterized protein n=1 Tax=Sylvanvirus sp. TaxID=2487774 RepID=A0A3G5AM79_9VIRU|nr:MAG: hypothetical protein Sylvanvirus27_3 [Sylvanvirus sp.]
MSTNPGLAFAPQVDSDVTVRLWNAIYNPSTITLDDLYLASFPLSPMGRARFCSSGTDIQRSSKALLDFCSDPTLAVEQQAEWTRQGALRKNAKEFKTYAWRPLRQMEMYMDLQIKDANKFNQSFSIFKTTIEPKMHQVVDIYDRGIKKRLASLTNEQRRQITTPQFNALLQDWTTNLPMYQNMTIRPGTSYIPLTNRLAMDRRILSESLQLLTALGQQKTLVNQSWIETIDDLTKRRAADNKSIVPRKVICKDGGYCVKNDEIERLYANGQLLTKKPNFSGYFSLLDDDLNNIDVGNMAWI